MAVRAAPSLGASLLPCAGLIVGCVTWAANMQLGQILPYLDCRSGLHLAALSSLVAACLTLGGSYLSWRSTGRAPVAAGEAAYPASRRFVAAVCTLSGLIFAYALLLQVLSGILLTGCER
ncbi:MAG: hypothetical protein JWR08_1764 [Enterovirga sp.]|nr:hypothetical protein [Enterovirga sp.]